MPGIYVLLRAKGEWRHLYCSWHGVDGSYVDGVDEKREHSESTPE